MDWKTFQKLSSENDQDKAGLAKTVKGILGPVGIAVMADALQMRINAAMEAKDMTMTLVYRLAIAQLSDIALSSVEDDLHKDKPSG